jgi:hypothetical protein
MFYMNNIIAPAAAALSLCLAAGLAPSQAHAQTLPVVDDFTTGPVLININGQAQTKNLLKKTTQTGAHILGGTRTLWENLHLSDNPFKQNLTVQIAPATSTAPAAFIYSEGYGADSVPQLFYGRADGVGAASLNADLTPYVSLRVTFLGIQSAVQFDWETWSGSNSTLYGCGLLETFTGETVDFPLANGQVNTGTGANLAAVDGLFFESQDGSVAGGGYAISQIAFVTASAPPADYVCPAQAASKPK